MGKSSWASHHGQGHHGVSRHARGLSRLVLGIHVLQHYGAAGITPWIDELAPVLPDVSYREDPSRVEKSRVEKRRVEKVESKN
jgi:hypothetical protein